MVTKSDSQMSNTHLNMDNTNGKAEASKIPSSKDSERAVVPPEEECVQGIAKILVVLALFITIFLNALDMVSPLLQSP
jgi:hypothetical protein